MLFAVIMAGGWGERFWPMSRRCSPKQSLKLVGSRTMIQQTYDRIHPLVKDENIIVVTGKDHATLIRRQLPQLKKRNIIVEPEGRNTAACIGLVSLYIRRRDPDAVTMVLPSDHLIRDQKAFLNGLNLAVDIARQSNALVTFGIKPLYPSTGYGYIKGQEAARFKVARCRLCRIERFVEKPSRPAAVRMVKSGKYFWNSGIFVWKVSAILSAVREEMPRLYAALKRIERSLGTAAEAETIRRVYARLEAISIDYGVMERVDNGCLLIADFDWNDIGSWTRLGMLRKADGARNVMMGRISSLETKNCIIVTDRRHLVGTVGISNLIVIHTPEATLICPRDRAEDVKMLVAEITREKGNRRYL